MKWVSILLLIGFLLPLRCDLARAAGPEAARAPLPDQPATAMPDTGWATQVSAGSGHTCALTVTGVVKCWGRNTYGQLGDGTTQQRLWPVDVIGLTTNVQAIAAGSWSTCAVTDDGGVKCWGRNNEGQLGDGTTTDRLTPVAVVGLAHGVSAIAVGSEYACALIEPGGVKCWGHNSGGQLGDGTTGDRLTPTEVVGISGEVVALSAGTDHTCAVTAAGAAYCWGWNSYGELGDGTITNRGRALPVVVTGLLSGVRAMSAGGVHTCAVMQTGAAKCWGGNDAGQLGSSPVPYPYATTPVDVVGLQSGVATLSAGSYYTCASLEHGGAKCWGADSSGQLGDGATARQRIPVDVIGLSGRVRSISAGYEYTCAVTDTGGVKCWGDNYYGQLGDGTTTRRLTPVDVLVFDCAGVSEIPQPECRALVALYNSTNVVGRNLWNNTTGWLRTATPCSWYGVTCAAGHVSGLDLHHNNLGGGLPPELGDLADLQTLNLSDNRILGPLPPELGRLSALQILDLSANYFEGALPPEWGNLAALRSLGLWSNYLSGPFPPEIAKLIALQYLNLSSNRFSGAISPVVGSLTALQFLVLTGNAFSGGIPPQLGNLTALQLLDLGLNQFSGPIPPELGNLHALQYLGLYKNNLSGSLPPELGNLHALQYLTLGYNNLSDPLPPEIGNLHQLRSLNLWHNQLSGPLPPELGHLSSLEYLDLSHNQITGPIPPEFGQLPLLTELYLSYNHLNGPIPSALGQAPVLTNINLSNNHLSGPIPPELGQLPALRGAAQTHAWRDVGSPASAISHLPWDPRALASNLSGRSSLRPDSRTVITSTAILRPPPPAPCCGYLDLSSNQLGGPIPPELAQLTGLNFLDLAGNRLRWAVPPGVAALAPYWRNFGHNLLDAPEYPDIATTQTMPPADVQVSSVGTYAILTWTPIAYTEDGGYYEISYATSADGPFLVHGHTTDKTVGGYTVTSLLPGRAYYFRIRTFTPAHTFGSYEDTGEWRGYTQQSDLWSSYSALASYNAQTSTATPTTIPTPTPTPTATATSTPVPGLVVRGRVRLTGAAGPGLPDVLVWVFLGSNAWPTIGALTDADGRYATGLIDVAGAELITVFPELTGYTFDPPQYVWQHAAGFEAAVRDFVAFGEPPTATNTVTATPTDTPTEIAIPTVTLSATPTATATWTPTATPSRRWLPLIWR